MPTRVSEVSPSQAWAGLESDATAVLVDVRTRAEWSFVGVVDLSAVGKSPVLLEWAQLPKMTPNPDFVADLTAALGETPPASVYFMCRSGARSMAAARAIAEAYAGGAAELNCINIAEGFEGDLNDAHHRGTKNGWKARGLAWRQS